MAKIITFVLYAILAFVILKVMLPTLWVLFWVGFTLYILKKIWTKFS